MTEVYSRAFFAPLPDFVERHCTLLLTRESVENLCKNELVSFKVLQKWYGMLLHLYECSTYYMDFLYLVQ